MTPQQKRVLTHLQTKGSIQTLEAWTDLGIYRLSDVVYKIKKQGYDIETKMTKSYNRFKEKVSFATYVYKGAK